MPDELLPRYVGVVFDTYTPQVEGQLTRDVIAFQNSPVMRDRELVIVCASDQPDRLLQALKVRRSPVLTLASVYIKYKTEELWPEVPEHVTTEIERDLYQAVARPNLDPTPRPGYFMPPQGRPAPDSIGLKRPAPNGYAPIDPGVVLLWG